MEVKYNYIQIMGEGKGGGSSALGQRLSLAISEGELKNAAWKRKGV
jgi:hypothetical protein